MAPLVRLEHVSKRFGPLTAVDDVSLEIAPGAFFALLGASGCGKTTLMRLIAGFETPDSGRIFIDGVDMAGVPPNRRPVNMMFQSYALFPHMNVAANIGYGLRRRGLPGAEIAKQVTQMLEFVQLQGLGERRPSQLSGGQQQRVALARALALRPKLLLLDEPMAALDRKLREETQLELIHLQAAQSAAFMLVTHDQGEALAMARTIAVMRAGKIVGQGTADDIYSRPASRYVAGFIGDINLIEGEIVEADGASLRLKNASGRTFYARPNAKNALRLGDYASLAIRPEFIRMSGEAAGATHNLMAGEVADVVFLGQSMVYRVRLADGAMVKVSAALGGVARRRYERGASVALWFAPEDAIVLEA